MKHRLLFTLALATVAFATVAAVALGGGKGRLYEFRGELLNASASSVQVQVDGGNHAALRALLGQSQNQSFTIDSSTQILVWSHGVPHVAAITDLKQGDDVTVDVRARRRSPAVADREHAGRPSRRPRHAVERRRQAAVALRRHRHRRPVGWPRCAARLEWQLAGAAVDARPVARPVVHL